MLKHAPGALPAFSHSWRIVRKEASLLEKTRARLFSQPIDADWVIALDRNDDLAERVEAFASRYSRLQDTLGEKLFPRLLELVGQRGQNLIDTLNQIERIGLLDNSLDWLTWRNLRNGLVHEYVEDAVDFAEALNTANQVAGRLLGVVEAVARWLPTVGVDQTMEGPP